MKFNIIYKKNALLFLIPFIILILSGCDQGSLPDKTAETLKESPSLTFDSQQQNNLQEDKERFTTMNGKGKVISKITTDTYVFMELENERKSTWVSTISIAVQKGDQVRYKEGQVMSGFYSKSLDKTFDQIVFVDRVTVNGKSPKLLAPPRRMSAPKGVVLPHGSSLGVPAGKTVKKIEIGSIKKLKGGFTVSELIGKSVELDGKMVKVRGRVVKFLPGIMKKNWIHLRDGSGKEGANDLTVTTQDQTNVGNTVSITGKLAANKDFGGGYSYSVIVEEATIVTE